MTRQDRELAIAANVAYVDAVLESVKGAAWTGVVVCIRILAGGGDGVPRGDARVGCRRRASSRSAPTCRPRCATTTGYVPPVLLMRGARRAVYAGDVRRGQSGAGAGAARTSRR